MRKGGTANEPWGYVWGPRGELQQVVQPGETGTFRYGYDKAARLRLIRSDASAQPVLSGAAEQETRQDYLGRETLRRVGTASWWTTWTGAESSTTEPDSAVVKRLYDGRWRVSRVEFQAPAATARFDVHDLKYTYTSDDQPLDVVESGLFGREIHHSYDERGLLRTLKRGTILSSDTISYVHEPSGALKSATPLEWFGLVNGTPTVYDYDSLGRLSWVNDGSRTVYYAWEPGGEVITSVMDSDVHEVRCIDPAGRLQKIIAGPSGTEPSCTVWPPQNGLKAFKYDYDDRGNRATEAVPASGPLGGEEETRFRYDAADRLTGVRYPDATAVLYRVGVDGARLAERHLSDYYGALESAEFNSAQSLGTLTRDSTYSFDDDGRLRKEVQEVPPGSHSSVPVKGWSWDLTGRLTGTLRYVPLAPTVYNEYADRTFAWDVAGRLREATSPAGAVEYTYEPDGLKRSRKFHPAQRPDGTTPPDEEAAFLWQRNGLFGEKTFGDPLRYVGVGPQAAYAGNARVLRDGLGSPVALADGEQLTRQWWYGAFGEYRYANAPEGGETLSFTGHAWDGAVGLLYAQQRWYEPGAGRFVSRDPARGQLDFPVTTSPYLYAAANPTGYVDPDGAFPVLAPLIWMGVGVAMDAGFGCIGDAAETGVWGGCGQAALNAVAPSMAAGAAATGVEMALGATPLGRGAKAGSLLRRFAVRQGTSALAGGVAGAAYAQARGEDVERGFVHGAVWGSAGGLAVEGMAAGLSAGARALAARRTAARFGATPIREASQAMQEVEAGLARAGGADELDDVLASRQATCAGGDCGVPGGVCFTAGTAVATPSGERAIETLRVGERVTTAGEWQGGETAVDGTWSHVGLAMPNPDGTDDTLEIELLRPPEWVTSVGAEVGEWVDFALPEMGLEGPARVEWVEPAPPVEPGPGRVVLATVTHLNGEVMRLELGDGEVLEPTATHRLYSADRKEWVRSVELDPGERLATVGGEVSVRAVEQKGGIEQVYNIEVETEHSYLVGSAGVLSHNVNECGRPPNLNTNTAVSRFGIYEIKVRGALFKIGKADLLRVTNESGIPTRLHAQLRRLRRDFGASSVTGRVVDDLGFVTTAEAKAAETARLRAWYRRTGNVPEGNRRSFKP